MRKLIRFLTGAALSAALLSAQTSTVVASGLERPYKLILTPAGNLLVSEAGTKANTGRVSYVSRAGAVRPLLTGLPSGASNPNLDFIGPTGLAYRNRVLYIVIGEGDSVRDGATPGSVALNPGGTSSPLFASVLRVRLDADPEALQSAFALAIAQHQTLDDGFEVTLTNAEGAKAVVDVLTDFPATSVDPNVKYRHHDPFAVTLDPVDANVLYVVEAGQNSLYRVNATTGRAQVVARFAPTPNPTQIGPPVIDAVPTGAVVVGNQVLVSMLSGFPFLPGNGSVRAVNITASPVTVDPWITGLNSAIDIGYRTVSGANRFFVLGFSSNMLGQPPGAGQLWQYDSPAGKVIANDLIAPTGMAVDQTSGDIFIAEVETGNIKKVTVQ
ncbi:MAG: ScyD/ScyE family protein [Acidobacteriota bacterium]